VAGLPNFRIETLQRGSATALTVTGELDGPACAELLEHFDALAGAPGAREMVLDLTGVSFIDSAGMRAIVLIERGAAERDLALTISPPPADVTELLRLTGITEHVALSPGTETVSPNTPFIERIELRLPRGPRAPGQARAELRGMLPGRIPDGDRATLTLLTSELVTNAVIHPAATDGGSIDLQITAYPDRVRVEVGDAGGGFDLQNLPPRPRESGGHGLIVVEGMSSRWGMSRRAGDEGDGFWVWFELDVEYQPESAAPAPESDEQPMAAADG
jgi:anti-anti-sigma factor